MLVDPVIQSPENSQSVNPYSYIMNNPLAGTDPTGYTSKTENEEMTEVKTTIKVGKETVNVTIKVDANGNAVSAEVSNGSASAQKVAKNAIKNADKSAADINSQSQSTSQNQNSTEKFHGVNTDQLVATADKKQWAKSALGHWESNCPGVTWKNEYLCYVTITRLVTTMAFRDHACGKGTEALEYMTNNFHSATAVKEYYSTELKEIGVKLARAHAAVFRRNGGKR